MLSSSELYNDRPKCKICEKSFVNQTVLNKHINGVHKNIAQFKCKYDECGRSFRTGYRLYVHELSHKGIKPFKCTICNKSFAEKGTLKVHLHSHAKYNKFKCDICKFGCKTNTHLREHYKYKHHILNYYKCQYCEKGFQLKSDYTFHLKSHKKEKSNLIISISVDSEDNGNKIQKGFDSSSLVPTTEICFGLYVY